MGKTVLVPKPISTIWWPIVILNFIYLLSISGTIAERKVIFKSFPARLLLDPYYLIIILRNTIENTKCRGRLKVAVSKCKAFNNLPYPLSLLWVYILIFISDLLSSSYVLVHTFSAIPFSCFFIWLTSHSRKLHIWSACGCIDLKFIGFVLVRHFTSGMRKKWEGHRYIITCNI